MSPEERQLRSMFGEDVADSISWSEYQGMRKAMSDRFGGIPAGQMDAANNAARAVYQDIGSALIKHFENTPRPKAVDWPTSDSDGLLSGYFSDQGQQHWF
jgi:hypothetical protein